MLHLTMEVSTILCVVLGLYMLFAGDWEGMHLKRAAVLLSTTAAMGFSYVIFIYPHSTQCAAPEPVCASFGIYCVFRNIAFLLFQYACGRDALDRKNQERRGIKAWTNMSLYSNRGRSRV